MLLLHLHIHINIIFIFAIQWQICGFKFRAKYAFFLGSSSIPGRQFSVDLRSDQARPRPVPSIEWQAAKIDSNFLINPTQPTGGLADDEKDDAVNDSDDDHVDDKV